MAEPRRLLIVVENLPVPADRRVWMEATALRDAGYEVSVVCPRGKGHDLPYETLDGIDVYRHPLPSEGRSAVAYLREYLSALFWELRLAWRARGGRRFDVIHICNPPDLLFLVAGLLKLIDGSRIVFDHHDLNPELFEVKFGRRGVFHGALMLAERLTFAVADVVIATNDAYRSIAIGRGRKRPEDVFIVRSGPDLRSFGPRRPAMELRSNASDVIGYIGIMAEQDGVENLLKAVEQLVTRLGKRDVHAVIIGDGPALPSMMALAEELGIQGHVTFTGYLGGEAMLEALSAIDIGVVPDPKNPYNDKCTMNKVLEYMAMGVPMVQFDLVEGRRSAGESALYVADNDAGAMAEAIARLIDDPTLAASMGRLGRERLERLFAWDRQVPCLLAAYRQADR